MVMNVREFESAYSLLENYSAVRRRLYDTPKQQEIDRLKLENTKLKLRVDDLEAEISLLKNNCEPGKPATLPTQIIVEVCRKYRLDRSQIFGTRRDRHYLNARHCAMAIMCRITRMSLPAIGQAMGGRDHTTVLHARDRLASIIDSIELTDTDAPAAWVEAVYERQYATQSAA